MFGRVVMTDKTPLFTTLEREYIFPVERDDQDEWMRQADAARDKAIQLGMVGPLWRRPFSMRTEVMTDVGWR